MRQRHEVEFEELVDVRLLQRRRDPNLVYPLGEVSVAALVDRYGDQAPARLLRAFARKDRPPQLVCRFRQVADSSQRDYLEPYRRDRGVFWPPQLPASPDILVSNRTERRQRTTCDM